MHPVTKQWDRDHHYDSDHTPHSAPLGRPCDRCGRAIENNINGAFIHASCLEAELIELYSDLRHQRRFYDRVNVRPVVPSRSRDTEG